MTYNANCHIKITGLIFCLFLQKTGNGLLYSFDPIAGKPGADISPGGMDLGFEVYQLALMSEVNDEFLKGLIIVGNDRKVSKDLG